MPLGVPRVALGAAALSYVTSHESRQQRPDGLLTTARGPAHAFPPARLSWPFSASMEDLPGHRLTGQVNPEEDEPTSCLE
ncbi:hypothetical protein EYF80_064367 [Liparis tanakae]|uniref:Uncharacterized protein n=1 Tax=Liparis tanakae TaxID=230148 RepID=A0A4Z2E9W7_9TELE|nr:hypothetical protein EYF80_064367 [Liparis tanakae]